MRRAPNVRLNLAPHSLCQNLVARRAIMPLATGTRLGPYEILDALGAGGMGEVYKARDTRLDRIVAIKILPTTDPDRRRRFAREANAIAALSHPHICMLHDVGEQNLPDRTLDFIVMEYLEGEPLADCLQAGPLPMEARRSSRIDSRTKTPIRRCNRRASPNAR